MTDKEACSVNGVTRNKSCVSVTGEERYTGNQDCVVTCKEDNLRTLTVNSSFVNHAHFVSGLPQKKGVIPNYCHLSPEIKHVQGVSCVDQSSSVQNVTKVPTVVPNLPVGARLHQFWEKWAALGVSPKVLAVLSEGYTLPFRFRPNLTRSPTITSCYANPHRNSYLLEALHQLLDKNAVELVQNPQSLGFYNRLFLVPKPNTWWRPILDLSTLNIFLKTVIQNGDPGDLPPGRGVGNLHRLQERVLPYANKQPVQEVHAFSYPGRDLSIQSTTLWCFHSPYGVYNSGQGSKTTSNETGYKDPPVPRRLVRARSHQTCLQHTQTLVALCRELGWLVKEEKLDLEPKQVFNFVGYWFDLKEGRVRLTLERWQTLQTKIREIMASPVCPVRNLMSLIRLLTATEKQVHLGCLHMRPIQWHLKNNWRVPETMEKTIPIPKSLHPHLEWWLEESNVITGQPLHPLKHALQIFTDASKEGWVLT